MEHRLEAGEALAGVSAARVSASVFGVLAGLGGLTHGIGEALQGNVAPDGVVIASWTQGPIATNMGGEPAMTLAPSLWVAGVLTIIVSLAVTVWAVAGVRGRHGGLILLLLSLAMLVVGGGFAPPVIGVLAGVGGLGIGARYSWWRTGTTAGVTRFLARLWPWVFGVCTTNGVFLVVGSVVLVYLFGLNAPDLFVDSFLFAIVSLLLSLLAGVAYDVERSPTPQIEAVDRRSTLG